MMVSLAYLTLAGLFNSIPCRRHTIDYATHCKSAQSESEPLRTGGEDDHSGTLGKRHDPQTGNAQSQSCGGDYTAYGEELAPIGHSSVVFDLGLIHIDIGSGQHKFIV